VREELPTRGFRIIESHPDGKALAGPNEGAEIWRFEAVYVTTEQLRTLGSRYHRCAVCSPDVPDAPVLTKEQQVRASSLRRTHLGRRFRGIGELREFRCTADGWTLIGERGQLELSDDELAYYAKETHTRGGD